MSSIGPFPVILAILGICMGVLAIAVSIEIAKRAQRQVDQCKADMDVHVSERFHQQDQELNALTGSIMSALRDMEKKSGIQMKHIKTLGRELNTRICRQDNQFDDNLVTLRKTIVALEQARQSQEAQLASVKTTLGVMTRHTGDTESAKSEQKPEH